jgi:hypothetical protein
MREQSQLSGPRAAGLEPVKKAQYFQNISWIFLVSFVCVSASINRMRAFCGLRSSLTTQSYLSSGCSPLRAMMPEPTRAERTG